MMVIFTRPVFRIVSVSSRGFISTLSNRFFEVNKLTWRKVRSTQGTDPRWFQRGDLVGESLRLVLPETSLLLAKYGIFHPFQEDLVEHLPAGWIAVLYLYSWSRSGDHRAFLGARWGGQPSTLLELAPLSSAYGEGVKQIQTWPDVSNHCLYRELSRVQADLPYISQLLDGFSNLLHLGCTTVDA